MSKKRAAEAPAEGDTERSVRRKTGGKDAAEESKEEAPTFEFKGQSILSTKPFTRADLDYLFSVAGEMRELVESQGGCELAKGRVSVNLFYEPSTRTSSSFQAAMLRLGGQVVSITDVQNSSVAKGETLSDTVRCLECYGDVLVLRHPVKGSAAEAAAAIKVPLLNAGDGVGEHPTQALLDCFTILAELVSACVCCALCCAPCVRESLLGGCSLC